LLRNIDSEINRNLAEMHLQMAWQAIAPAHYGQLQSFLETPNSPDDSIAHYLPQVISVSSYAINDGYLNRYVERNFRYDPTLDSLLLELRYLFRDIATAKGLLTSYREGETIPYVHRHFDFSDPASVTPFRSVAFINQVRWLKTLETEHLRTLTQSMKLMEDVSSRIGLLL
ncbi:MAG: hypothetical protein AAFQ98_07485, partial [Bacteroidota bacterium]